MSFGDRTRAQNLNWTTFYNTSAEFGHFTSPSQPQARHEPSSSQAQMLLFFLFSILRFMATEKENIFI